MNDKYHKGYRSIYSLTAHVVFVCKYRRKLFNPDRLKRVEQLLIETSEKWGCEIKEISGESDHIHFLLDYPPKVQLSNLIANLKTVSSRIYRKEFALNHALWTGSYFVASCGGVTVEQLKAYVEGQSRPNR